MSGAAISTLIAIAVQVALGLAVYQANRHRRANQSFLLLSGVIGIWLGSLYQTMTVSRSGEALFYIRQASAAGAYILVAFHILRLSMQTGEHSWKVIFFKARWWLGMGTAVAVFCQTNFFLKGVSWTQSATSGVPTPTPVYGTAAFVFVAYFIIAGVSYVVGYARDLRRSSGRQQAEIAFILIGAVVTLATVLIAFVLRFFVDQSRLIWFAPFRIVLFSLIIAYGIATQKIMEVGLFIRRAIGYSLLTLYLLALYGVVWWLVLTVAGPVFAGDASRIAHVLAAIAIAFAMAPARGVSQGVADRLFIGSRRLDFRATVNKAIAILRSVSTISELLEKFATTIAEAVDTDRILILQPSRIGFAQQYPPLPATGRVGLIELSKDDPLIRHLEMSPEPIVLDEINLIRPTPQMERVARRMGSIQIAVAVGIFSRDQLAGVLLLGPRRSGQIYGSAEQNALQVLSGQLAVAIENAHLFTEVQNAKIYNETLLQNMTTGVIAADVDGLISVFNREAEQITNLSSTNLVGEAVYVLPLALREVIQDTLRSGERQENRELELQAKGEEVIVRASSSVFHGEDGTMLGAMMVLTDVTALKRLELQIRRSDRLASLGTLSAGMAHEIKNPLVSIKTFAQLLPERYQDSDFRETFSNLIGHEIDRIDSLVNQLLRFAKPTKPLLKPVHLHEVLEKSLMLVGHRLYQKEIKLTRSWNADVDTIRADGDQMEQVFLNFFLNAMDAMQQGGELTVSTEIRPANDWAALKGTGRSGEILRVTVRDNGEGIKAENVAHVFDPFFTTKDYGTGLGLSVVHGIVQEHGGQIEVESELAQGTSFHILLPLVRFVEEVAAA